MIRVPDVVANKAREVGATRWLDELPALVSALEHEWRIHVGRPYTDGTEAFVAEAKGHDGAEAVLKLVVPRAQGPTLAETTVRETANGQRSAEPLRHTPARAEITVLELANGHGCAELLRHDADRGALLLERLGPSMHDLGLPIDERHVLLCAAARRVWRPAPEATLPNGAQKAARLTDFIPEKWAQLGSPCATATIDHAITCAERRRRAHDDERAMLLHGDVHEWNALAGADGFKLVDPDGLLAEPEYDLGVMMREDPVELMAESDPRDRAHRFARMTGTDATAIWEWGVVERVSTGLLCVAVGLQPVGTQMLATADWIAAEHAA